jgi:hypothetical protein
LVYKCYGQQSVADFQKLDWLIGTWNQTNVTKPGRTSHEYWAKSNQSGLSGYAVTLQGFDTVFVEKTTIIQKDNALYYVADVPGNNAPIYFKFTELTTTGFVCENPQHDFPKRISYQLDGQKLKAQISGNGKTVDYYFERK